MNTQARALEAGAMPDGMQLWLAATRISEAGRGAIMLVSLGVSLLLLLHHKIKHSRPGPHYIADPCEQWFQYRLHPEGDVCNWRTCSHEMWIIFLVAVALGAAVAVAWLGC